MRPLCPEGPTRTAAGCIEDGTVLASFDGGACTTTILTADDDGEVTVQDRGEEDDRPTRDE